MDVLLILGAFWTVYGLLGLAGWQRLPARYRGHRWTARYTRQLGLSWILLGIPWLLAGILVRNSAMPWGGQCVVMVLVSLPSIVYTWALDRQYKKRLRRARRAEIADLGGQRPPGPGNKGRNTPALGI